MQHSPMVEIQIHMFVCGSYWPAKIPCIDELKAFCEISPYQYGRFGGIPKIINGESFTNSEDLAWLIGEMVKLKSD